MPVAKRVITTSIGQAEITRVSETELEVTYYRVLDARDRWVDWEKAATMTVTFPNGEEPDWDHVEVDIGKLLMKAPRERNTMPNRILLALMQGKKLLRAA